MLLILGGLPAVGKTKIAAELARSIKAVHLRIDSIEQALRNSHVAISGPEGYVVAYAVAEDNLRLGRTVIADSVNPVEVTRAAWRMVAQRAGKRYVEIEIVCSDQAEHQRRVESRMADISGHQLPTWQQVCARDYEPWPAAIVIDTAKQEIEGTVSTLLQRLEPFTANAATAHEFGGLTP